MGSCQIAPTNGRTPRVLKGLGLTDGEIAQIRQAVEIEGPSAAARFITTDMLKKYQIVGTPAECSQAFEELVNEHNLDIFLLNVASPDFDSNLELLRNTRAIISQH